MRRRKLKALWHRLGEIQGQDLTRDQRLEKLGAARLNLTLPPQPPPRISAPKSH